MSLVTRLVLCIAVVAGIGCSEDLVLPTAESPSIDSMYSQLESVAGQEVQSIVGLLETILGPVKARRASIEGGSSGKPSVWTYTVEREHLDQFASPFLLTVTNGNPDGSGRVSAGAVVIDGQEILGPSAFSRNVERLEREVEIHTGSVLGVRVNGAPGGVLTIEIRGTRLVTDGYVYIAPGTFEMGSPTTEPDRGSNETQHMVTLTTPFEMAVTEVTNAQYAELAQWAVHNGHATATSSSLRDALDGSTQELLDLDWACAISYTGGQFVVDAGKENHPVVAVSWYGAVAYCDWLSLRQGLPPAYDHSTWTVTAASPYAAEGYRLPTEAEWEYACRAGTTTAFNNGTSCLSADTEANYYGRAPLTGCPSGVLRGATVEVGSFPANARGLHDMHGNVWEWCHDWHSSYSGDVTDPEGPSTGSVRVIRGGSWRSGALGCRSAVRGSGSPSLSIDIFGLRPVRSVF